MYLAEYDVSSRTNIWWQLNGHDMVYLYTGFREMHLFGLMCLRGATEGLKIVGECFPWSSSSTFTYTLSNHKSVLGIGAYAQQAKAQLHALSKSELEHWLEQPWTANDLPGKNAEQANSSSSSSSSTQFLHCTSESGLADGSGQDVTGAIDHHLPARHSRASDEDDMTVTHHLLAYPAKCNYDGVLYPLDWIQQVMIY
jgi:hypothetical protein